MLVLDSGDSDVTRAVLSGELSSEDDSIKPVSDESSNRSTSTRSKNQS